MNWELTSTAVIITNGEPQILPTPSILNPIFIRSIVGEYSPVRAFTNVAITRSPQIHYTLNEGTPIERREYVKVNSVDLVGGLVVIPSFYGDGWDIVHWQGSPVANLISGKEFAVTLATQLHNYFNWEWHSIQVWLQIKHNPAATKTMVRVIDGYNGRYGPNHYDVPVFPTLVGEKC